jgi:hypothetical protein
MCSRGVVLKKTKPGGVMKKIVIVLWGTENVGKSQTILKVYNELRKNKRMTLVNGRFNRNMTDVLAILCAENKIKIGIMSSGDPKSKIKEDLGVLKNYKCEIIICATRGFGMPANAVNDLRKGLNGYEIMVWLKKAKKQNNNIMANNIVREVRRIIDNSARCIPKLFYYN